MEDQDPPGPNVARRGAGLPLRWFVGVCLALLGLSAVLVATALAPVTSATMLGGDFPVNAGASDQRDISAHNSPTIVQNPTDGANLVVANRIDSPRYSCAVHVSFDGGARWAPTSLPLPPEEEPKCFAPDLAFGADGELYLSFVTLGGEGNVPNAVWLVRSIDGGRSLSAPVRVLGPHAFQVRLASDPTAPKRVYLSWLQAEELGVFSFSPGQPIQLIRSDDGGETWSQPVRVSDLARQRVVAPTLTVDAEGELYVLHLDLGNDRLDYEGGHEGLGGEPYRGTWQLVLARSSDRGEHWTTRVVEPRLRPADRILVFLPPFPSLAMDRGGKRLYVAFHDLHGASADVSLWVSDDSGSTFGPRRRITREPHDEATSQYLPKVGVAPDGRVDVVYYDRRKDRSNIMTEVSIQTSHDRGRSFHRRIVLSSRSFDSRIGFGSDRGMPDLGNRLGLVSTDSRAMAVWSDTRNGTEASNKQNLMRAVVEFRRQGTLSSGGRRVLQATGSVVALLGITLFGSALLKRPSAEHAG